LNGFFVIEEISTCPT